jgi:hypothetical protein
MLSEVPSADGEADGENRPEEGLWVLGLLCVS